MSDIKPFLLIGGIYRGDSLSGATFSEDTAYRYALWRRWGRPALNGFPPEDDCLAAFIGLNPSTADEFQDDPTIRHCIGFAKSWGMNGIVMLNLFAFRATDPNDMKAATDPVGPLNDNAIRQIADACHTVVCCWGVHGSFRGRSAEVKKLFERTPFCLGRTKDGHPKHPLYLPAKAERMVY